MGTRSVIAVPRGDGWWGRYVHWDGYPSGVGAQLVRIVTRDGLETATRVLTREHNGWSLIDADEPDKVPSLGAERGVTVVGYGEAYSKAEQSDGWVTSTGDTWGTEWAYVLTPGGLVVLEATWEKARPWQHRDVIPWTAPERLMEIDAA